LEVEGESVEVGVVGGDVEDAVEREVSGGRGTEVEGR
jgi:hypothetical protein